MSQVQALGVNKPIAFIQGMDEDIDGVGRIMITLRRLGLGSRDFLIGEYDYLPQELEDTFSKGFRAACGRMGRGVKVTVAWPILWCKGVQNE